MSFLRSFAAGVRAAAAPDPASMACVTRLHASEHQALLDLAGRLGCDEHQALLWCVDRQLEALAGQEAPAGAGPPPGRPGAGDVRGSVVASSPGYSPAERERVLRYGRLAGCRTPMAARRHALAAQLRDEGRLAPGAQPPAGFTGQAFIWRQAGTCPADRPRQIRWLMANALDAEVRPESSRARFAAPDRESGLMLLRKTLPLREILAGAAAIPFQKAAADALPAIASAADADAALGWWARQASPGAKAVNLGLLRLPGRKGRRGSFDAALAEEALRILKRRPPEERADALIAAGLACPAGLVLGDGHPWTADGGGAVRWRDPAAGCLLRMPGGTRCLASLPGRAPGEVLLWDGLPGSAFGLPGGHGAIRVQRAAGQAMTFGQAAEAILEAARPGAVITAMRLGVIVATAGPAPEPQLRLLQAGRPAIARFLAQGGAPDLDASVLPWLAGALYRPDLPPVASRRQRAAELSVPHSPYLRRAPEGPPDEA